MLNYTNIRYIAGVGWISEASSTIYQSLVDDGYALSTLRWLRWLSFYREGNNVVVKCQDDGR